MFLVAASTARLGLDLILFVLYRTGRNRHREIRTKSPGSSEQALNCMTLFDRKRRGRG